MVAAAPLGDVVEQHRDIDNAPRDDLVENRGRERMVGAQFTLLDPREQADRTDAVLVDGVVVVHVELHLRDDTAEIGHEPAEYGGFVHPAQHRFGVSVRRQHLHEQRIGPRIAPDFCADQPGVAVRRAHRLRVDLKAMFVGQRKDLDQANRVLPEPVVRRQRKAAPVQHEPR